MIEFVIDCVVLGVVGSLVGMLIRRRHRQRSARAADGAPTGIPCMIKRASHGNRWRPGRLLTHAKPLTWRPAYGRSAVVLPDDLHRTAVRAVSTREGLVINPGSRIVECASSDGTVLIAVMPVDLEQVTGALSAA
ncbi:hypothetical protein ACFU8W_19770 [Streptomyces sp. NPDC057565]|uniref:hypothetical protein n=1 Tax=Streptomyces sp. NPDC057565 TaxID=3346169 RepID=UPI00368E0528